MNIEDQNKKDEILLKKLSTLAKDIVANFFAVILKNNKEFNQKKAKTIKLYLDTFKLKKSADNNCSYATCNTEEREINIYQSFFHEEFMDQLFIIVHEYIHAMSDFVYKDKTSSIVEMPDVIEEGMAETIAELALNSYIERGFATNKKFKNNNLQSKEYLPCTHLIKMFLAISEVNQEDYKFIYNYFFKNKNQFYEYIVNKFGKEIVRFISEIQGIDPKDDNYKLEDIYAYIDKSFKKNMPDLFNLNIDKVINYSTKKKNLVSIYYYKNWYIQKYTFQKLLKQHMKTLDYDEFVALLKKFKPILKSGFMDQELNSLIRVFYYQNPTRIVELVDYLKFLPKDVATDLLNKKLEKSDDKMKTVTSYLSLIKDNTCEISRYLNYYNQADSSKSRFDFLIKILTTKEKIDSYYYYEFIKACDHDLTREEIIKSKQIIRNFFKNNVLESNQEYLAKTIVLLKPFISQKLHGDKYLLMTTNSLKISYFDEMMEIIKYNLAITFFDTQTLELEIDFTETKTLDTLTELLKNKKIVYFRKYLGNGLNQMLNLIDEKSKIDKI